MSRFLLALLAALAVVPVAPGPAPAAGAGDWQADPLFQFDWQLPPPPGGASIGAYRIYDSEGNLVRAETRSLAKLSDPILIAPVPGAYTLEAWFQNEAGERGAAGTATLRFDNVAPPAPVLQPPAGWLRGMEAATLQIAPAAGPLPISGVSGYALSLDRGSESSPCASPLRCAPTEVDLAGSAGGTVSLGILPEGLHLVRVVAVSGSGVASPVATAQLRVDSTPPTVSLGGVPAGWSDGPVQVTALAADEVSGMAPTDALGPFTAIAVDGGPASRSFGDVTSAWVTGSGVHKVEYFARDVAGNVADGMAGTPPPATATVRIDEDPPAVAFSAAQDPAEPERIEASVSDALSGPSPGRGWIGVRLAGTGMGFAPLPTRVAGNRLVAHWDSDSFPPGNYEFLAAGFDAAGNAGVGTDRARGGRMVLVNPLKVSTALEAGFIGKDAEAGSAKRARYGRGVRFGGRLTALGAPTAGLEVAVTEVFTGEAKPSRRTTLVRTGSDGRFGARLAPGPSREVVASFAGTRTLSRASSQSAQVEVPTSVRLRASATVARVGGAPVVFRGRVAAAGTKASAVANLPIELQFRFRGGGWSEFRTVETNARGRFRYPYRFSDDDSRGIRFQFRAYVKGREGWPYGPSASRPVLVTGR
jgi:hypothetical protein